MVRRLSDTLADTTLPADALAEMERLKDAASAAAYLAGNSRKSALAASVA